MPLVKSNIKLFLNHWTDVPAFMLAWLFSLIACVISYQKLVVLATVYRTWTSSQTFLICFNLCKSFCQFSRRGQQQQLTSVLLTERGLTRTWRHKATKVMAAGHRRNIFHRWVWAPGKHSSTEQKGAGSNANYPVYISEIHCHSLRTYLQIEL